jgi:hypothetical protein
MNRVDQDSGGTTRKANQRPRFLLKGLVVIGTVLVCLLILEVGLRIMGRYPTNSSTGFFAQGRSGYRLKKNFSQTIHWPAGSFIVTTDEMGFRFKTNGPRNLVDRNYYVALGASEVFGDGLDYEKSLMGVLGEKLEDDGIQLVNMAVGGHHLDMQIDTFNEFAATAQALPEKVLICLNPKFIMEYDDRSTNVVVRWGYLFGERGWKMALTKKVVENNLKTYCFFRDGIRNIQVHYFLQKDFDLEYYYDIYSKTNSIRSPDRTKDFLAHLETLEDRLREREITPVCVYCPTVGGFYLNKLRSEGELAGIDFDTEFFPELVKAHCEAAGIQFINLESLLQESFDAGKTLNLKLDGHFNAATSRIIGDFLYSSLKPGLAQAPGKNRTQNATPRPNAPSQTTPGG